MKCRYLYNTLANDKFEHQDSMWLVKVIPAQEWPNRLTEATLYLETPADVVEQPNEALLAQKARAASPHQSSAPLQRNPEPETSQGWSKAT